LNCHPIRSIPTWKSNRQLRLSSNLGSIENGFRKSGQKPVFLLDPRALSQKLKFLESYAGEVMNMLTTEWDWDIAREVWKEGWEEGLEKGRKKGREEAVKRLLKYGMTPEQIAEALELPPDTVHTYLEAE
jgi:hypothetical protein